MSGAICTFISPRDPVTHQLKATSLIPANSNVALIKSPGPANHVACTASRQCLSGDWHKRCKVMFRSTVNAIEWTAPSVNDDRPAFKAWERQR